MNINSGLNSLYTLIIGVSGVADAPGNSTIKPGLTAKASERSKLQRSAKTAAISPARWPDFRIHAQSWFEGAERGGG